MITKCKACGAEVDTSKPEGWTGYHRYGCIGPSTWSGVLEGYGYWGYCWCGKPAVIRICRGLYEYGACCPEHARSRKTRKTEAPSPFSVFVTACYRNGVKF